MATTEDTSLYKLAWYRAGGDVSTRNGTMSGASSKHHWAGYLKVEDLLERVFSECGLRG